MSNLPKAAVAILALPGVESLEREPDGWCCHLAYGWTTSALSGGGTIIDSNLKTIRAHVVGAYQIEDCETAETVQATPIELVPTADFPMVPEWYLDNLESVTVIPPVTLPRVCLRPFVVAFAVPTLTGAHCRGWITVKATDLESAADWFYNHRAALGLPLTAEIDTVRTA